MTTESDALSYSPSSRAFCRQNSTSSTGPLSCSIAGDGGTGETFNLVYYVGFYLPAALMGKLLGWQAANELIELLNTQGLNQNLPSSQSDYYEASFEKRKSSTSS